MQRLFTYCLLLLISLTNCVEPYNFEPDEPGFYLVVSGGVNQLDNENRLRITRSTAYGSSATASPVDDATVTLIDGQNRTTSFYPEGDGFYVQFSAEMPIVVGNAYHLEIEHQGKTYRTDPQVVPVPVEADSLQFEVNYRTSINTLGNEITFENIDLFINTPINVQNEPTYLRWKSEESWAFTERKCHPLHNPKTCFMSNQLSTESIYIYSSEDVSSDYLYRELIAQKRILERMEFIEKHYFVAHQLTLTKETYDYWEKVVQLANPSGNIFDLPPAPLKGNVYNVNDREEIVLGYFEVVGKSFVKKPLYQSDILPLTVPSKDYLCSYWGGYAEVCCNCLNLPSSSVVRPEYWN